TPNKMAKRSHNELSLERKCALIKEAESLPKPTQKELGEKFKIARQTVSDILKRKYAYLKQHEDNLNASRKRLKPTCRFEQVNVLLWEWFKQACAKKMPILGTILQTKALEFANHLNIEDFKASNGWLECWRSRYAVKFSKLSRDSVKVNLESVSEFKAKLAERCAGYDISDIFNCDETCLWFRLLPDRTLAQMADKCKGGKDAKERLTVLFCCSATGEKLKPLVIGKAAKPLCFGHIDPATLPVTWTGNNKAWMTTVLFCAWLKELNKTMHTKKRNILLLLDNATSHCIEALSNVQMLLLPPNTTSFLQPLEQGIIQNVKLLYRTHLMSNLVAKINNSSSATELSKSITVLDAIYWIEQAWSQVKDSTITKCFAKAGLGTDSEIIKTETSESNESETWLQQLIEHVGVQITTAEYMNFDDSFPTEETYGNDWEQQLLAQHLNPATVNVSTFKDQSDVEEETSASPVSLSEALNTL
ncbi:tigger transposable element-derived protein 6-like, partial [Huso huso]